jgi:hypothetical protein
LQAIVVEQWTRSEHNGFNQFATLEEPQLDEHPIRFRSFAHAREMSRRIAKRLARVRRDLRQESPPRDSGPDAQSVDGRVDENALIPNRTNTDSSFRGTGEAREAGIQ